MDSVIAGNRGGIKPLGKRNLAYSSKQKPRPIAGPGLVTSGLIKGEPSISLNRCW